MASVVRHARRHALATGEFALFRADDPKFSDGEQHRDFVFVEDCIDHILWLRDHPEVSGIFNSGTGISRRFAELVRAVFDALGLEPRIRYIDIPASLGRQYQNFTQANMTKLREAGYSKASTSLEDGVRRTFAAHGPTHPTPEEY